MRAPAIFLRDCLRWKLAERARFAVTPVKAQRARGRQGLGAQAEFRRLFVARTANDHVEKNDPVLFAADLVRRARGDFFAVTTNEFHAAKIQQVKCLVVRGPQVAARDKYS